MAGGLTPVIDSVYPLAEFAKGLDKLEGRKAFGKVIVAF
jgi:NADPH:quinone reductase-like Zn-dependent oxidoreductase